MQSVSDIHNFSYVRVRYEDLVSENHTKEILDELYEFMQIPYDLDAQNTTLGYLMHGESRDTHSQYYALFRDREFDPNHWTKELSKKVKAIKTFIALFSCLNNFPLLQRVSQVEKWCSGVIQELGYPLFNATTTNAASVSNKSGNQNPAKGNMSPR